MDSDPDAVRLEPGTGLMADVTPSSGPLASEPAIPCRAGVVFGGDGSVKSDPISQGCEVIIAIPDGDPNVSPIIIGALQNPADCAFPEAVNETEIDEAYAQATHIFVTPHGVDEEVAGDVRVRTPGTHRVLADTLVELAEQGATQSFVRGQDLSSAVSGFTAAMKIYVDAVSAAVPATSGAGAAFKLAIDQFVSGVSAALSTRIKGE